MKSCSIFTQEKGEKFGQISANFGITETGADHGSILLYFSAQTGH